MAGKNGGFRSVLNFLGIVDDGPQDDYENYDRGGRMQKSRGSTYIPASQRGRTDDTRRRAVSENNRYAASRAQEADEGYTVRRAERAYETEPARPARERAQAAAPRRENPAPAPRASARSARQDADLPVAAAQRGAARTIMYSISTLEECCDVINTLVGNNIVLLMLDRMDPKNVQRAVDTLSGAAYALQATLKCASERTYLIAPRSVSVDETGGTYRRY